jgi:acetoin utilization deacetylase AcuC-like enzyme
MATLYISHPTFLEHDTGEGHPERPDRLRAIEKALQHNAFDDLQREIATQAPIEALERVHTSAFVESIRRASPEWGYAHLDGDTPMSPASFAAALLAAGAGLRAVDAVIGGSAQNAFCAVRPPGHHAEPKRAMGFCLFNNIAIAAKYAHAQHGLERVAVVDFDVHHGNGTQAAFWSEPNLFFASTHQMPLFPGTGAANETGVSNNIVNVPLAPGSAGKEFREAYTNRILPALEAFSPNLILISAGFDAHRNDPLSNIGLVEEDYIWSTMRLAEVAHKCCDGRIVSMLEGGYDLRALAQSVAGHIKALMDAGNG